MFKLIKEKRKSITIMLIITTISVIILPLFIINNKSIIGEQISRLDISNIIAQILSAFFIIIGTFIAVSQYYITSKAETIKIETDKIERSIKLAEYYKNEILEPYAVIKAIYESAGIYNLLQKEKNQMHEFDSQEMNEIFSPDEINQLSNMHNSDKFWDAVLETNDILNLKLNGLTYEYVTDDDEHHKKIVEIDVRKAVNDFRGKYISDLLNNMELFSMYFNQKIADESAVFKSLYPTYIEICRTLYYEISRCSVPGKQYLYRNVQKLYETWLVKSKSNKTPNTNFDSSKECFDNNL